MKYLSGLCLGLLLALQLQAIKPAKEEGGQKAKKAVAKTAPKETPKKEKKSAGKKDKKADKDSSKAKAVKGKSTPKKTEDDSATTGTFKLKEGTVIQFSPERVEMYHAQIGIIRAPGITIDLPACKKTLIVSAGMTRGEVRKAIKSSGLL